MLARSNDFYTWQHLSDIAIAADIFLDVGAENSNFQATNGGTANRYLAKISAMWNFAISVVTDDAVTVEIQIGNVPATMVTMATLTCAVGLAVNTTYNLPPPHAGPTLTVTGHYLRLRVVNGTGNLVSPFHLYARAWK